MGLKLQSVENGRRKLLMKQLNSRAIICSVKTEDPILSRANLGI